MTRADRFRDSIHEFLRQMEFDSVCGTESAGLEPELGIDYLAEANDALFVVRCEYAGRRRETVRNLVSRYRGDVSHVRRALRDKEAYARFNRIHFVLAIGNYPADKSECRTARKDRPSIHIWDGRLTSYYKKLAKAIHKYAKFNLLGEMRLSPESTQPYRIPAIRVSLKGHVLFLFYAKPSELLPLCYVARRDKGEEDFYQRLVSADRLRDIAEYIEDRSSIFPNSVILAINRTAKFLVPDELQGSDWMQHWPPNTAVGTLQLPRDHMSCFIIDGQHRMYAFAHAESEFPVPVAAFRKLEPERQTQFFIDINANAKSVDSDLIWDLLGDTQPDSYKGVISRAVKKLGSLPPLKGVVYVPLAGGAKRGKLKLSALCSAIDRAGLARETLPGLHTTNRLHSGNSKQKCTRIASFLSDTLSAAHAKMTDLQRGGFLLNAGGVSLLIYFVARCLACHPERRNHSRVLQLAGCFADTLPTGQSELKSLVQRCAGEGGRAEVLRYMTWFVSEVAQDHLLGRSTGKPRLIEEITSMERTMASAVHTVLSASESNWLRAWFGGVAPRVEDSRRRKHRDDTRTELHEFLTFGQMKTILQHDGAWNILSGSFVGFHDAFDSRGELVVAVDKVSSFRNPPAHGGRLLISERDLSLVNAYKAKLEHCCSRVSAS